VTRSCACGCGEVVEGPAFKRFVSDTHRKRAARAAVSTHAAADKVGRPPAKNGQGSAGEWGRVRAGLEAWLAERAVDDLPSALVASAQALADELDRDTTASPMWGRYTTVLTELVTPQLEARAWSDQIEDIFREMASVDAAEQWRAERYQRALANGEPDAGRWTRLVPLACARADHRWHQPSPGAVTWCLDCRAYLEDDGRVWWPDWWTGDEP
jgi:hypothetical protein